MLFSEHVSQFLRDVMLETCVTSVCRLQLLEKVKEKQTSKSKLPSQALH